MHRRTLLLASAVAPFAASAEGAPIRFVLGFPAGTTADTSARLYAAEMKEALGSPVVVENRVGGGGMIAAELVANAAPDGRTVLVASNGPLAINRHLGVHLPYDPDRDLLPVAMLGISQQLLIVPPPFGPRDFAAFLDRARQEEISYASVGTGSGSHLVMAGLVAAAEMKAQHVPYRGGPQALTDLLAGRVQAMILTAGSALGLISEGKLLCLAQTGPGRLLPDVPTLAELGYPGLELPTWNALYVPRGTPDPVIRRIADAAVAARAAPSVREGMAKAAFEMPALETDRLGAYVAAESERWAAIARATGVTMND
jgi:tripartite-type tricarboxylate transporter receptor subunit TctC